ncbi:hypothetical protein N657DRAFT_629069 [Parathielavia appendiculata]|uniref:Uncharacterized protein n=1 Tax=Parathielavia appendiculata TaxID=2587402 RepID=A0AAN6TP23_9PEZI|nr:hypothetical protein N657DRAFT_629069 [Parathielavia appendiculata]
MPPVRTPKKNSSSAKAQPPGLKNSGRAATEKWQSKLTEIWAPQQRVGAVCGSGPYVPALQSSADACPAPVELPANSDAPLPKTEIPSTSKPLPGSSSDVASAPAPSPPKTPIDAVTKRWSVPKGEKEVHFVSDREWEEGWQKKLGTVTKKLTFGYNFILTDQHIEQLASLGPSICRNLTHFEFSYSDVSYTAHNANKLTDDAAARLARMCPSLRVVQLQGADADRLTDATVTAFLANCPNLTSIEITGERAAGAIKEAFFDALREHPNWAPKLKTLRIPGCGSLAHQGRWMKAMRALSRERETLVIELVSVSQVKKWGDWELETFQDKYRKGKVQPW